MTPTQLATFTTQARDLIAASDAAREAHIAALVARADFEAWSASMGSVSS